MDVIITQNGNKMKSTADIKILLARRHPTDGGEWMTMFELRNGTGWSARQERYLDCFALNLYPSKNHIRHAYEIKISRNDWLKELSQPEKRTWGLEISNQFWFIAPTGIIKKEEVPEGCGLLRVTDNGKLVRDVIAQHRKTRDFDIGEICAMLRSVANIKNDALWKHQGKELNHLEMMEVLSENKGRIIHQEASIIAGQKLDKIKQTLTSYAEELERAGCIPPKWMKDGNLDRAYSFDALRWVSENVSPGLQAHQIEMAIKKIEESTFALERIKNGLKEQIE